MRKVMASTKDPGRVTQRLRPSSFPTRLNPCPTIPLGPVRGLLIYSRRDLVISVCRRLLMPGNLAALCLDSPQIDASIFAVLRWGRAMRKFKTPFLIEAEEFFDMADVRPERTGLPFAVLIMDAMGSRHGVRLKVAPRLRWRRSEMLTVVIRPRIRVIDGELATHELALLTRWINLNRKTLIRYWEGEFGTLGAYELLKPLRVVKPTYVGRRAGKGFIRYWYGSKTGCTEDFLRALKPIDASEE